MLAALATTLLLPLLAVALPQSAAPSGPSIQSTVTSASGKNNYYKGCFDELKAGLKALNHPVEVAAASFTPQSCVSACEAAGYTISGLMNGNTCFCDNAISAKAPKLKDSECNNTCAGDSGLFCGGTFHLQVYYTKRSGLPKPTAPQRVGEDPQEYEYLGCWSSTHEERALQGHYIGADNITPASCASQCYALGFKFAGTHFGRECFCGQTLIKSKPETPSDCSYACAGDSTQLCGSDNHINLYVAQDPPDVLGPKFHAGGLLTAYFSVGCYVDPVNPRLLGTLLGSGNDMTADKCANLASKQRLAYFGVENGNECFGADRLPATADQVDPSSCNTACRGNDNYSCGGGGRLDLYKSPLWSIF